MKMSLAMDLKRMFFACTQGKTKGPLNSIEVEQMIVETPDALIWWKGQLHWQTAGEWLACKERVLGEQRQVYYLDHERHIPRTIEEVTDLLIPSKAVLSQVKIWSPVDGFSRSVFESRSICEAMGLRRRENIRTALDGNVTISKGKIILNAEIDTISSVGIGIHLNRNLDPALAGEFTITFKRTELLDVAPVSAELLYSQKDGVGFKFSRMSAETSHHIIGHVRSREGRTTVGYAA